MRPCHLRVVGVFAYGAKGRTGVTWWFLSFIYNYLYEGKKGWYYWYGLGVW